MYYRILTFGKTRVPVRLYYRSRERAEADFRKVEQDPVCTTARLVEFPDRRSAIEADISDYTNYGGRCIRSK